MRVDKRYEALRIITCGWHTGSNGLCVSAQDRIGHPARNEPDVRHAIYHDVAAMPIDLVNSNDQRKVTELVASGPTFSLAELPDWYAQLSRWMSTGVERISHLEQMR